MKLGVRLIENYMQREKKESNQEYRGLFFNLGSVSNVTIADNVPKVRNLLKCLRLRQQNNKH